MVLGPGEVVVDRQPLRRAAQPGALEDHPQGIMIERDGPHRL